jgi:hypothetical protein
MEVPLTGDDATKSGTLKVGVSNSGWKKRFQKSINSKEIVIHLLL